MAPATSAIAAASVSRGPAWDAGGGGTGAATPVRARASSAATCSVAPRSVAGAPCAASAAASNVAPSRSQKLAADRSIASGRPRAAAPARSVAFQIAPAPCASSRPVTASTTSPACSITDRRTGAGMNGAFRSLVGGCWFRSSDASTVATQRRLAPASLPDLANNQKFLELSVPEMAVYGTKIRLLTCPLYDSYVDGLSPTG